MPTEANAINASAAGLVINTGTAFTSTTVTQHDVLVGGASNAITSVSPSTSGFVLTSNGVSADPSFQAAPLSSRWVYLDKKSAASAPTIVFTSGISSTYNNYIFIIDALVSASAQVYFQWSTDGGSTYTTSDYNGGIIYSNPATGAGAFTAESSTEGIEVALSGAGTDPGACVELWLMNRNGSTSVKGEGFFSSDFSNANYVVIAGTNSSVHSGINAVRFTTPSQSSNITSGSITLYGLAEA